MIRQIVKSYALNDGRRVPWLAFGTGTVLYAKNCTALASRALELGFTHLDTAQSYQNEDSLGDSVDAFVASGGDSRVRKERREGLYITTKLEKIPEGESVEDKLRASLRKLRVNYVNLFLVHNPLQHIAREGGLKGVWREMVEVKRKGLAHSIGVSNFNRAQLEEIVSLGLDVPAINQIEYHPLVARTLEPLIAYHRTHGIVTASYGGLTPIIRDRLPETVADPIVSNARNQLLKTLDALADARGGTRGQVLLKWLQGEGVVAVTTSSKDERLKEYLDADGLADLVGSEKMLIRDAVGDAHFRAFVRRKSLLIVT